MYEFFKCHTRVSSSAHHTPPLSAGHSMRGQGEGSLASLPIHEGIRWSLKIKIEIEMKERKEYEYKPDSFRKLSSEFRQIANVRVLYMVILYCI